MDREGQRPATGQGAKSGAYVVRRSSDGATYTVEAGERFFLVVVAFGRTLVFQRISRPEGYITRREVLHEMDPELAVTGYVLSFDATHDPLVKLKAELDRQQKSYWGLHKELTRVRAELERAKKRGKHVRRNS